MRDVSEFPEIYLYRQFVDMRKSINGLSILAEQELEADWTREQLFVFCNRRRNLMKMVYFDKSGFAMWTKRLEQSKFPWPKDLEEDRVIMTSSDVKSMLLGMNIWTRFKKLNYKTVI